MNVHVSTHTAREAFRAEPHKLLMGTCIAGATLFWGVALWVGYF
ncbi:hypothetical protein [Tanticharoenia sakaeratensis]|uniref:Uncharacterized protein n=1 Tax=Tanticharoenia sakaeratensis NBRC 103193 TaxID=1231623 RepID=A0A0D6MJB6_9PROT|nr:hypothetical protein [Tanticharoenia sakaeratensis]GAN53581.1 hypothetical protein Tasa_010_128 [Tanticharoenia sakaeratensis NBRC 103193]GBQ17492.1 hypothetical protein AA103193_0359 [Tanticharoenia sakaeratensis NBRC 103193]